MKRNFQKLYRDFGGELDEPDVDVEDPLIQEMVRQSKDRANSAT